LDVEVEAGAAAQITTTGATRLYRHRPAPRIRTAFQVHRRRGGLLEYLPDAVIPYGKSRHVQRTEIHLGRGSTLFWWEMLAPGRLAAGERFAFERLRVQTKCTRVASFAARGLSSGAPEQRTRRDAPHVRVLAYGEPLRGSGRTAGRVLAIVGERLE